MSLVMEASQFSHGVNSVLELPMTGVRLVVEVPRENRFAANNPPRSRARPIPLRPLFPST